MAQNIDAHKAQTTQTLHIVRDANQSAWHKSLSLQDIYVTITSHERLKSIVGDIRQAAQNGNEPAKNALKKTLPAFIASGIFPPGTRRQAAAIGHTGFAQIDLDHVTEHGLDPATVRDSLALLPCVALAFVSPSGDGVKALIKVDIQKSKDETWAEAHKAHYNSACEHVATHLQRALGVALEPDAACKDLARMCFFSSDVQAYLNTEAKPFAAQRRTKAHKAHKAHTATTQPEWQGANADAKAVQATLQATLTLIGHVDAMSDGRKRHAYKIACACYDYGLLLGEAYAVTTQISQAHYAPPLDSATLAKQASDAYKYAEGIHGAKRHILDAEIYRAQAHTFAARYVPEKVFDGVEEKVILLESPQGTGKTTLLESLVKNAQKNDRAIVYVSHRKALIKQVSKSLGLTYYEDKEEFIGKPRCIAVTPNSLFKHKPKGDALLIIDEIDQVFSTLSGSTCKDNRLEILTAIKGHIDGAGQVVGLSADIPRHVVQVFENLGHSPKRIVNTYKQPGRTAIFTTSVAGLFDAASKELSAGRRVAVAFDSKAESEVWARWLEETFPHKRLICINSDNSGDDEVKKLIEDPMGFMAFDIVLHSPSFGSGVNIDIDFSESRTHYLYAGGGSLAAKELIQLASRFRRWTSLHVYCTGRQPETVLPTDAPTIREKWLKEDADFATMYTQKVNGAKSILPGYEWAEKLAASVIAENNRSKNFLFGELCNELKAKGFAIKQSEKLLESEDKKLRKQRWQIKTDIKEEQRAAIIASDDIDTLEADSLKTQKHLEKEARLKLEKYFFRATIETLQTPHTDSQALLELASKRAKQPTWAKWKRGYAHFVDNHTDIVERELQNVSGFAVDVNKAQRTVEAAKVRKTIEADLRMLTGAAYSSHKDADKLREIVSKHKDAATEYLFNVTEKMLQKPVLFVRSFYRSAGLKLCVSKRKKTGERIYTIDAEAKEFMAGVISRRDARRASEVSHEISESLTKQVTPARPIDRRREYERTAPRLWEPLPDFWGALAPA